MVCEQLLAPDLKHLSLTELMALGSHTATFHRQIQHKYHNPQDSIRPVRGGRIILDFNCKALLHQHHPQIHQRVFKTPSLPKTMHTGSQPWAGEREEHQLPHLPPLAVLGLKQYATFVPISFTVTKKRHCWRHQSRTPSPLAPVLQMPDGGR